MEITILSGSLAFLVLVVWLSKKLNAYSYEHYGYIPIGFATIILSMIPYIILIAGYLLEDSGENNMPLAMLFAGISVLILYLWLAKQSSHMVALGGTVILMLAGLPAVLFLFFSSRGDDYYYYD